jgi:TetR/AcrR family transcriptional regulator, transcriptional repressor for nem operon
MTSILYVVNDSDIWSIHMKVSREQAAEHHRRIVGTAGRMFREKGFDGVGVADIMQGAGLTHGGFYGHFASKEDLAAQACVEASKLDRWIELAKRSPNNPLAAIVRSYLSPRHRDDPGSGCVLAALGPETARQRGGVRHAFTDGLRARLDFLAGMLPGRSKAARRRKALVTMAGLVGALVLARAVDDPALSSEILKAAAATFGAASPD